MYDKCMRIFLIPIPSDRLYFFDDAQVALVIPLVSKMFKVADALSNAHSRGRVRLSLVLHVFQMWIKVQAAKKK
jgi:hypothetical protein